jgi:membrane fusion protein (multidrug efflux system)
VLQRELAEAQAQQARRDCERAVQLLNEGVIAPADAQALETRCTVTSLQVEAAGAQVGVVDVVVGDATVRAPFGGIVSNAMTEVGAFVQPPSPVIDLHQIDPLTLVVALPAMYVGAIDVGQRVLVDFPDLLGVPTREATVSRVAPSLSPMTRSLPVEVSVPNADVALRGGLFARARFVSGSRQVAALPEAAVRDVDGRLRAYVVRDGEAVEVLVDRQTPYEGFYRAPATVAEGDTVVLDAPADLRDGSRVITGASARPAPAVAPSEPPSAAPSAGSGAE